jgi:cysteine desulfurase / selenocysteine lyase
MEFLEGMSPMLPNFPTNFDPRAEFPILEHWDFYNHAGVAPLSKRAADALVKYAGEAQTEAYLSGRWYSQAEHCRKLCAKLVGSTPEEIAFVKNTSEGIAFVANGLEWHADDEIVSTAVEYPANVYPWMDVAQRFGVRHVMVPERDGRILLDDLFAAVTPKTRLLAISHVEYASGFRNDIAKIGAFCRSRGILFLVDAIQSLGIIPVDVEAMKIDFLSADGHKWMLGPEGAGFFYCRQEHLMKLRPEVGWMNVINAQAYGSYDFTLRNDARRFECGTYNIPGILSLSASLQLIDELGIDFIGRRVEGLTQMLCDGLREKGYDVFSPRGAGEWSGIVTFTSPTHDHATILKTLHAKKIALVLREGRLRASPHFYNSAEQIARLLKELP